MNKVWCICLCFPAQEGKASSAFPSPVEPFSLNREFSIKQENIVLVYRRQRPPALDFLDSLCSLCSVSLASQLIMKFKPRADTRHWKRALHFVFSLVVKSTSVACWLAPFESNFLANTLSSSQTGLFGTSFEPSSGQEQCLCWLVLAHSRTHSHPPIWRTTQNPKIPTTIHWLITNSSPIDRDCRLYIETAES